MERGSPVDCRLDMILLRRLMEKIVRKFSSFDAADDAEYEYYRGLTGDEKLQMLLELIMPEDPNAAVIERSARIHSLTEHEEC